MDAPVLEPEYEIPDEPSGLVAVPGLEYAGALIRANEEARASWAFEVAGQSGKQFAMNVRQSALEVARRYCRDRGIEFTEQDGPLIVTGHQPALFHSGVWAKNFLVDALSKSLGGTGLNLVVDSDAAGDAGFDVPLWEGGALKLARRQVVAVPGSDSPYESIGVPSLPQLQDLCASVEEELATLPSSSALEAFRGFRDELLNVARDSTDLGELLTRARRGFEAGTGTSYLELPVSAQCASDEFLTFFLAVAERMEEFQAIHNGSLDRYRHRYEIRSAANPFPNLDVNGDLVESPFWLMDGAGLRATLWLKRKGDLSMVCHANGCRVELERGAYRENVARLRQERVQIRPKALVLTLFNRLFLSDLFVHGIGGAKYDRVTDDIAARFFNLRAPGYVAATATVWLDTGVDPSSGPSAAELRQRLHALEHNPDRFANDPSIDAALQPRIGELVQRKDALKSEISADGADKKALGAEIRQVNGRLAELMAPLCEAVKRQIADKEVAEVSLRVARHRDFPFCYSRPEKIRDLVEQALPAAAMKGSETRDGT